MTRESDAEREAREDREALERIEAKIERDRRKREVTEAYEKGIEDISYSLDLQNKKVAKQLGWFDMFFGKSHTDDPIEDAREEAPSNVKRHIVCKETGLKDDGYMYEFTYWSDGTGTETRL